ncbi:Sorting nexin-27 [Dermatophagoides farinae]|uniref:Sorting nexin-27 n=1 Tax=Dermatophagoides farinae TaxID=6954 RepID=A0A922L3B6_DERFA|nr:Sorting nexin-27 [Dermatophagoides farinae]
MAENFPNNQMTNTESSSSSTLQFPSTTTATTSSSPIVTTTTPTSSPTPPPPPPSSSTSSLGYISGPHLVTIYKTETGFGFNVRGQVSEGGPLRSINGELYAPLQHVSAVLENGAAEKAGIRKGDRILEVNGVNVEGATHKQVVDLIKSSGDKLVLTVISVTPREAEKLEPSDDGNNFVYDYSEKRSLPITIPDYSWIEKNNSGERYCVYNIYMAGRHLCSRRYREFLNLHNNLKREFNEFIFPKFPGKWPFSLSYQQLDSRRRGLESYIEKVCAVRVIGESDIIQEFLTDYDDEHGTNQTPVDLKILLPNRTAITITVRKNSCTKEVYDAIIEKINLSPDLASYFAIFEIVEQGFERKLQSNEFPYNLYIQNIQNTSAASTCLMMKKWFFHLSTELELCTKEDLLEQFFYYQSIEDVNKGQIKAGNKLYELKALQEISKKSDYLKLARKLDGYGEITFPHCASDARKEGHIMCIIGYDSFKLQACRDDGMIEDKKIEFQWNTLKEWYVDDEGISFVFVYNKPDNRLRRVRIHTPYVKYISK